MDRCNLPLQKHWGAKKTVAERVEATENTNGRFDSLNDHKKKGEKFFAPTS